MAEAGEVGAMFLGLGFLGESSWWDIHMQTGLLLLPGSVS